MRFYVYLDSLFYDRLQTGMRGAFGKPQGVCARVSIGQVLLSVRCKEANAAVAAEALRRAKFKFPGRQKIIVSRKWYISCFLFLFFSCFGRGLLESPSKTRFRNIFQIFANLI